MLVAERAVHYIQCAYLVTTSSNLNLAGLNIDTQGIVNVACLFARPVIRDCIILTTKEC